MGLCLAALWAAGAPLLQEWLPNAHLHWLLCSLHIVYAVPSSPVWFDQTLIARRQSELSDFRTCSEFSLTKDLKVQLAHCKIFHQLGFLKSCEQYYLEQDRQNFQSGL